VKWSVTANPAPPPPGQLAPAYRSDYFFKIDELRITRDDPATAEDESLSPLLLDTFETTAPPAPQGNYALTLGSFTTDGQHAVMNGQVAGAIGGVGTLDLLAAHVAVADTNISASSPGRGLKSHHDFTAEARFELDFLPDPGESFGISLSDRAAGELPPDQLGDDVLFLTVTRNAEGNLIVQFDERDAVADSITVLGTLPLDDQTPAAGSEIVLRLVHDTDDLGRVQASFDVLEGGISVQTGVFVEDLDRADRIFGAETPLDPYDDEVWTRVQIVASGRDTAGQTAQGRFGTLSIEDNGNWTYTLDNADPDTQNLGHGVIGMDSFNWRATDEYGASTIRTFNINVIGTGDAPAANTVGGPGNDMLLGSPNADHLTGGLGADLLIGLDGSDIFDYNSLADRTDSTGQRIDTIADFTPGAGGDILDLSDLLIGYVQEVSNAANFVQLQQFQTPNGPSGTQVAVNEDGLSFDFVPMVTLQDVVGLSFQDFSAHNLLL
jgi:VCBS repeat-containing protein